MAISKLSEVQFLVSQVGLHFLDLVHHELLSLA